MKNLIILSLGAVFLAGFSVAWAQTESGSSGASSGTVQSESGDSTGAAVDYFLKIDGVDGESTEEEGESALEEGESRAEGADYNSSRSNKTHGVAEFDDGDESMDDSDSADSQAQEMFKLQKANDELKTSGVEREMKESGEKGGTEDINISVGELQVEQGNVVSARAVEVRGWDPDQKQEFLATVKAQAEVQSGEDLDTFARGVLISDEQVDEVSIHEDSVEVHYRMPAKFLGIFDSTLTTRTEVVFGDGERGRVPAEVKVKFPWYAFLFGKFVSASDMETDVQASLPEIDDEVLVGFEARAGILESLSLALKARHDVAMGTIRNVR